MRNCSSCVSSELVSSGRITVSELSLVRSVQATVKTIPLTCNRRFPHESHSTQFDAHSYSSLYFLSVTLETDFQ